MPYREVEEERKEKGADLNECQARDIEKKK
jgi:hypothetical protein